MAVGQQETQTTGQLQDERRPRRAVAVSRSNLSQLAVLMLLVGVALWLRLHRLGAQSLWLDEGNTWNYVRSLGWGALLLELGSPNAAYPLYHLLIKGWIAWAGDSEFALRLPSAIAGALAVPALYALGRRIAGGAVATGAALLMLVSPFALWQAQDAKAYSLQILVATVSLILFWEALMLGGRRRWLYLLALALVALLVHRLSALLVIGAVASLQLPALRAQAGALLQSARLRRLLQMLTLLLPLIAAVGLWWGLRRAEGAAQPETPSGPLEVMRAAIEGLLLYRSSPQLWLVLPFVMLIGWGAISLARDLRGGPLRVGATFVAGVGLLPLSLYVLLLLVVPHPFDARYLSAVYPLFLLLLAWPLRPAGQQAERSAGRRLRQAAAWVVVLLALAASGVALTQRPAGLFSGAPVKEEYRQAVNYLAQKVHPDDVVIIHPHYIAPLYRYYARPGRVTPDRLPEPVVMPKLGAVGYDFGEFDDDLNAIFKGHNRAWLLEAPEHGIKVDPPTTPFDKQHMMGHLAINFYYAADHYKWPCGEQPWKEFLGVRILCQSFPETYGERTVPEPEVRLRALFGDIIELRGYTLNFFPGSNERAQAGGALPITLYWRSTRALRPEENYVVFLHLVRQLGERPVAQEDIPPLEGALATNTWKGDPVHDEHAIPLPANLEPGRYKLLLGLFNVNDPSEAGRLPVSESEAPAGENYIELCTVEVVRP